MKVSRAVLRSLALGAVLGSGPAVFAEENAAAELAKAPAAVQAAAKKALGEKKLEEFDKMRLGGKTLYEAGFKVGGVDHSVIINEAGEVVEEEADFEVSSLPAPVVEALKKAHPDGKIDEAAQATIGGESYYDVDVKVGKDTRSIKVKADGTITADDVEEAAN